MIPGGVMRKDVLLSTFVRTSRRRNEGKAEYNYVLCTALV